MRRDSRADSRAAFARAPRGMRSGPCKGLGARVTAMIPVSFGGCMSGPGSEAPSG